MSFSNPTTNEKKFLYIFSIVCFLVAIYFFVAGYKTGSERKQMIQSSFSIVDRVPEQRRKIEEISVTISYPFANKSDLLDALKEFTEQNCGYNCAVRFSFTQSNNELVNGIYFKEGDDLRIFSNNFK